MGRLEGKAALVTGASAGIGAAIAWELAQGGADVAINYLTYHDEALALAQRIKNLGRRVLLFQFDVSDESGVERMVAKTAQEFGRLDIVVANAANSSDAYLLRSRHGGFSQSLRRHTLGRVLLLSICRPPPGQARAGRPHDCYRLASRARSLAFEHGLQHGQGRSIKWPEPRRSN